MLALYTDLQIPSRRDMHTSQLSSSCVAEQDARFWCLGVFTNSISVKRGSQIQDCSPAAIGTHAVNITLCKQELML